MHVEILQNLCPPLSYTRYSWHLTKCGHVATGQWQESLEHGHGQCVTADGATYDGAWNKGLRLTWLNPELAKDLHKPAVAHCQDSMHVAACCLPCIRPTFSMKHLCLNTPIPNTCMHLSLQPTDAIQTCFQHDKSCLSAWKQLCWMCSMQEMHACDVDAGKAR